MRIVRFPSLTENQFFGCTAAFVDALTGELNTTNMALRRLEGKSKGSAFAHEMDLDQHRYAVLIVLDRWSTLVGTFGPHMLLSRRQTILSQTQARVSAAEMLIQQANQLIDASESYSAAVVEACGLALQTLKSTFGEEFAEAEQTGKLGPMLAEEYREARQIFREDLAAR